MRDKQYHAQCAPRRQDVRAALLKDRSGSMFVFVLIILTFLFTFSGVAGEYYRIHSIQTHAEYEIQRAVNIAVEDAMYDSFRQDKLNMLNTTQARQNFMDYLHHSMELTPALEKIVDGSPIYSIQFNSVTATEDPPRLLAQGTLIIPSAYPFLITNVDVPFNIASRNRRID